jgi:starch-binding outer membrane protein, SusD/RagB family
MIRSLGYYYLIDFFGNVPIVTSYDSTNSILYGNNVDFAIGRKMLFDTIVHDIITSIPDLSPVFNNTTFGTFHKWAAFALLAKMYINAEEWTGAQKNDECIAACDSIISSGIFSIADDYFSNFKQLNENSKENIFVIPYKQNSSELNEDFYFLFLHYHSNLTYLTAEAPWNAICALPDHYHSFDSIDVRRNGWSTGPQFESDSVTPILLAVGPYNGEYLDFTPDFIDINWKAAGRSAPYMDDEFSYMLCLENNGARLVKYEIAKGLPHTCQGVPLPVFRYADILLLKAEAIMRNNHGVATSEAVDLVNQIRARAGVAPYNTSNLTINELLAERGREFYFEGMRRQDLIRFGKFVRGTWGRNFSGPYQAQWYNRSGEEDYRNVFPIPIPQVLPNLNYLHQNPGY